MILYLDDDMAAPLLARLLGNAGHDVMLPADVGLSGDDDAVHFRYAAINGRAMVTGNHDDYENLGVLAVRKDNDPKRDLTYAGIVRALRNLLAANAPTADQCVVLNHWR